MNLNIAQTILTRQTCQEDNLLAQLKSLQIESDNIEKNIGQLNSELKSALLAGDFAAVENAVRSHDESAANGMLVQGVYYKHQGQSYSQLLKSRTPQAAPEDLEVGMIPGQDGKILGTEIVTHPIKLDGEFIIEYARLVEFWNTTETSFLGFWKTKRENAGINPITGQPIQTIAYDYELRSKTVQFMATNGYFEEAKTIVVKRDTPSGWGLSMPMSRRRQRALASHHDAEGGDEMKMAPK